jgi:thymidylate synthase ThyX
MDDRLARYVTNLDRDVFALRDLPEEVIAVLFAYYSRSRDDLRTNLRRLLDDRDLDVVGEPSTPGVAFGSAQEKARAFHEKWVVGYGHSSVAEHAVVHLAVERCSILAAKALEEARLAAYTEKSTRYVRFDEGTLVTDVGLPPALGATYEAQARRLLAVYAQLADRVERALGVRYPVPDGTTPKAHAATLRAHGCDLLRGLLPAGVPTNVGVTINARALEQHIGKLLVSPLAEVRRMAAAMRDEAAVMVPTLLKYTAPSAHRASVYERVMRAHGALHALPEPQEDVLVRRLDHTPDPLRTLATAVQCELFGASWRQAWHAAHDPEHALALVRAYLGDRGAHDAPLRALEQVQFRFEVCCDYGAWRDLQRHRLLSATTPRLGTREGYVVSEELDAMGFGAAVREALDAVAEPHHALAASHPWEAQYLVPLAYRVRYVLQGNLRELFHLIELRSARQGHEAYRKVAQALATRVTEVCPWLNEHLRADHAAYPFARH